MNTAINTKPPMKIKKQNTTGRYSVGEKLLVVAQVVRAPLKAFSTGDHQFQVFTSPLSKWMAKEYGLKHHHFEFLELTVTEHHKVPSEWDSEEKLDCDGYVLVDDQGRKFTNQYPRASYGQTTDTGNRIFYAAYLDEGEGSDRDAVHEFFEKEHKAKGTPYQYALMTEFIDGCWTQPSKKKKIIDSINAGDTKHDMATMLYLDTIHRELEMALKAHPVYGKKYKLADETIYEDTNPAGEYWSIIRRGAVPI